MTSRAAAVVLFLFAGCGQALAEPYAPWDSEPFWDRPAQSQSNRYRDLDAPPPAQVPQTQRR